MNIELTTSSETAPLEILDLQVSTRRVTGRSVLSLRFLCHSDQYANHLHIPTLTWFDASRLQQFSQTLAASQHPETCRVDLIDAELRLTGSVRRLAGRWTTGRLIRVEPMPNASAQFSVFTIYASQSDVKTYANKLYNRLWEVFTRG